MDATPIAAPGSADALKAIRLANGNGFAVEVIPYGATVTSLVAPDREGRLTDVVLGFRDAGDYLAPHPYFGAVAGRVAGRITGARFVLNGELHELAVNDPPNHVHGGKVGFDRRVWTTASLTRADGNASLRLTYRSPDGEEGYPGTVEATVTYTVTFDNELVMETEAVTDRATPFSLTQHSYFNLAGEGSGSVEGHELQILGDTYAPTDERMGLLGRRESVAGNDFRVSRRIGEALPHLFQRHGDLYFLPETGQLSREPRVAARLYEPVSGRLLTVSTNEDCIQLYTGVSLDGKLIGKSGKAYGRHAGLCLECEGYPDGANTPALGDIILRPGQHFSRTTIYAFSIL